MSKTMKVHVANSLGRLDAFRGLFGGEPTEAFPFPDDDYPIEVLVFSLEMDATPFVVAVTSGMSDFRMMDEEHDQWGRREVIQYLPHCDEEHAQRLRDMAWLPLFDKFFLDTHHTIDWPYAAVEGSPWKRAFFLEPFLKPHRNFRFTVAGDEASFLWHIPISDEEYEYKKEFGIDALINRMDERSLPWIFDENNRPPLC